MKEGLSPTAGYIASIYTSCSYCKHLVDLLFGVWEQIGEVGEHVTVEHHLGLLVRPGHNVTHCPQCSRLRERTIYPKHADKYHGAISLNNKTKTQTLYTFLLHSVFILHGYIITHSFTNWSCICIRGITVELFIQNKYYKRLQILLFDFTGKKNQWKYQAALVSGKTVAYTRSSHSFDPEEPVCDAKYFHQYFSPKQHPKTHAHTQLRLKALNATARWSFWNNRQHDLMLGTQIPLFTVSWAPAKLEKLHHCMWENHWHIKLN